MWQCVEGVPVTLCGSPLSPSGARPHAAPLHGYHPGPTATPHPGLLHCSPLPAGSPLQPLPPSLPTQFSHTSLLLVPHLRPFARLFWGQKFLPRYPWDSPRCL